MTRKLYVHRETGVIVAIRMVMRSRIKRDARRIVRMIDCMKRRFAIGEGYPPWMLDYHFFDPDAQVVIRFNYLRTPSLNGHRAIGLAEFRENYRPIQTRL
jgi:hypothetical protein